MYTVATKQHDMRFAQICPQEGYDTALEIATTGM